MTTGGVDDEAKLEALKYLGHWVGDVHQPLHVSFEDDRGGNNISVTGECRSNLHAAWDTCLVLKAVGADADQAPIELLKTITPIRIESWTHSAPMDWANESFAVAEQAQTKYCLRQGASRAQPAGKVTIDAGYVAANAPIVSETVAEGRCQAGAYARCCFGQVATLRTSSRVPQNGADGMREHQSRFNRPALTTRSQCRGGFFAGVRMEKMGASRCIGKHSSGARFGTEGA